MFTNICLPPPPPHFPIADPAVNGGPPSKKAKATTKAATKAASVPVEGE